MSLLLSPMAKNSSAGFYNGVATQSVRFNSGSNTYLARTPSSTSNRKTWTWSAWIKFQNIDNYGILFGSANSGDIWNTVDSTTIGFNQAKGIIGFFHSGTHYRKTTQIFRDFSAWGNLVVAVDTTSGTANDRIKMYWNGVEITSFATSSNPSQNLDTKMNYTVNHSIGGQSTNVANSYTNAYMSDVNFIDGQALTPTSFGEAKSGAWIPIDTSGLTFGTNGFRLKFDQVGVGTASTSTIGADTSGNTNHYTSGGIVASDCAMPDSPENNFATMNPLNKSTSMPHFSEGNLKLAPNAGNYNMAFSNMGVSSGKFYYELGITGATNSADIHGVIDLSGIDYSNTNTTSVADKGYAYYALNGNKIGIGSNTSFGAAYGNGDIISVALDIDAGKVWFAKNGTYQASGNPATGANEAFSGLSGTYFAGATLYAGGFTAVIYNFGQDSSFAGTETAQGNTDANGIGDFYYAPPTGYLALCTSNLPEPTIGANSDTQADDHFNTVLYSGNGGTQAITGVGFQPDWVWIKERSSTSSHALFDSNRGVTNLLSSDSTSAETDSNDSLTAFGTDGFTSGSDGKTNQSSQTYVGWNWKANGGTTVTNEAGSIDSTVQANTDAGFSIVTYVGTGSNATVGHGLSKAPDFMVAKSRSATGNWYSYQGDGTKTMLFNSSAVEFATGDKWNNTDTTATLFSLGTEANINGDGNNHIAYCFHSVEGYSKIGSYTGNASADGAFVYTGFRPAWVIVKAATGAVQHWWMFDNKREGYNVDNDPIYANLTAAEETADILDFVSNGFKMRTSSAVTNASGVTYIYMAFGDSTKYANAR